MKPKRIATRCYTLPFDAKRKTKRRCARMCTLSVRVQLLYGSDVRFRVEFVEASNFRGFLGISSNTILLLTNFYDFFILVWTRILYKILQKLTLRVTWFSKFHPTSYFKYPSVGFRTFKQGKYFFRTFWSILKIEVFILKLFRFNPSPQVLPTMRNCKKNGIFWARRLTNRLLIPGMKLWRLF